MVRKRGEHGVLILTAAFFISFTFIALNYYRIAVEQKDVPAAQLESTLTIEAGRCQGTIYDRNMRPLINAEKKHIAAAVPSALDREQTAEYAIDKDSFYEQFDKGEPFVFDCSDKALESDGLTIFEVPIRYSEHQTAQHIIGYLSDDKGADGIEYAYDDILRNNFPSNSVSYKKDGMGRILIGDGKKVFRSSSYKTGVVLTLDSDIQKICEDCGSRIDTGAIVCADVKTGDILGLASFPCYETSDIEKAMKDRRCPLIDRALYSYSVGSVFKLVTAAAAIEEGFGGRTYACTGSTDIEGKIFNCHKLDGHGLQDMTEAMTNSCNTYFIDLARSLDIGKYRQMAEYLGFGKENYLCAGVTGSGGVLPTEKQLSVPAERANFSFGQGKLAATPLQITQLTCGICNGGDMPVLRLIKGITADGEAVADEKPTRYSTAMSSDTAMQLRKMMISAVRDNENSKARSNVISLGAKTSTAQTGKLDEKGEELCHAWITGFFPSRKPKYAVTVLIENGGYGNEAAAPVFREIAEKIRELNIKKK
ncbi:MAG: penicillin-binding protein 2 [Ruminococcus sp.]|uniref:peptidoglycan D,D-transpeptidase FtsI family protein n=1 Tax=Ruminococcus sp. TaxID=41978 RepID=UPI0025EEB26D|nr:penicillin-binding protein 2 [Ruminococcus sp.]MCR5599355.1 penicillin-binding protein 2 [Ruminococcus sp.]